MLITLRDVRCIHDLGCNEIEKFALTEIIGQDLNNFLKNYSTHKISLILFGEHGSEPVT